ncbi:MAG: DUF4157 domain-containing protein [Chloroflexota bacterium]
MAKQAQTPDHDGTAHTRPQPKDKLLETAVVAPAPALQQTTADLRALTPAHAKTLQRAIGNQALGRLTLQRKMTLGPVGDAYEQEADAVAKQVVRRLHISPAQSVPAQTTQRQEDEEKLQMKPLIQRQEEEEELQMNPLPTISALQRQEEEEELQMKPSLQRQEEEEELQMKPLPAISSLQRQEDEEELQMKPHSQRQEDEEELQAKGDSMLAGGELSGDVENRVQSAKSGGQPMPENLRAPLEQAFNADFSSVTLHTDSTADSLNRSLSARAFTTGQDIFFRSGEYNPSSSAGQELLAHELTHTVQQSGGSLQKKPQKESLQRAFHPAAVTANAHLRNMGNWKTHVGSKIPSGAEVVVDQNQQQTQNKSKFFGGTENITWSKAVNVTGANWNWNVHNAAATYIRNASIGAQKTYPENVPDAKPPTRHQLNTPKRKWHEQTGEYVELEKSVSVPGAMLVLKNGVHRRLTAANQFQDMDNHERYQLDATLLNTYLKDRTKQILHTAAAATNWTDLFANDYNVNKLLDDSEDGSKALRKSQGSGFTGDNYINWYNWLNGPFTRIQNGAQFVVNSLEHWRNWLNPTSPDQVAITEIKLAGSDLHEEGLGAMFITFTKPIGPMGHKFANETNFTVVVKSEDKSLEKNLFGTEGSSLANKVNQMAGLDPQEAITTFRMETSHNYGSLIEMVQGTAAKSLAADPTRRASPGMREAMVFAFITGLSDLHKENIIWNNGKPYFIDADNALNKARLDFTIGDKARDQSGFTRYNEDDAVDIQDDIQNNPQNVNSKIMKALLEDKDINLEPVVDAVKNSFAGKSGRIVPVATASWGSTLRGNYIYFSDGAIGDDTWNTRWGIAEKKSHHVPTGTPETPEPGLEGEAGIARNGRFFNQVTERQEIKNDFDQGQIPFYNYKYDNGHVVHNGQVVWHGQPLAESLEILFNKFPNQRNTWET